MLSCIYLVNFQSIRAAVQRLSTQLMWSRCAAAYEIRASASLLRENKMRSMQPSSLMPSSHLSNAMESTMDPRPTSKASGFAFFSQLPPEIRRQIWYQCLPRRVVEMGCSYPHRASCGSHKTYYLSGIRNARPPAITSVCREAAYVARNAGRRAKFPRTSGRKEPVWLQPERDSTLYLFENGYIGAWIGYLDPQPLLHHCDEHGMIPSLDAKFAFPSVQVDRIDIHRENLEVSMIDHFTSNTQECVKALVKFDRWNRRPLNIYIDVLSLPLDDGALLASGLFGLLGDEPIQAVNMDDTKRLHEFHDFIQTHFSQTDCESMKTRPKERFEAIICPSYNEKVQIWKEVIEWLILTYMWLGEKKHIQNSDEKGPLDSYCLVWLPRYTAGQSVISYREHRLNEDHPWVIGARKRMWQIQPQLMIRACCNTCLDT